MNRNEVIDSVCAKIKAEKDYTTYKGVQFKAKEYVLNYQMASSKDSKNLKKHTLEMIHPVIALYKAMLENGFDDESAVKTIREALLAGAAGEQEGLQKKAKFLGAYKKYPAKAKEALNAEYGPDGGYETKTLAGDFHIEVSKCPYVEVTKQFEVPQLAPLFCEYFKAAYGTLHPCLALTMAKTMGQGDDVCDIELKVTK